MHKDCKCTQWKRGSAYEAKFSCTKINHNDAQIPLLRVSALPGFHHQGVLMLREAASPNWCNVTKTDAHQFHSKHSITYRRTPISPQTQYHLQTHTNFTPNVVSPTDAHQFHPKHSITYRRTPISPQTQYHIQRHTNFTPNTVSPTDAHQFHPKRSITYRRTPVSPQTQYQSSPEGQWASKGPTLKANTDGATCVCSKWIRCLTSQQCGTEYSY